MLYKKNIEDIDWEDIVNFCDQQIPENPTLDYKKDFPSNLQKSIAAFSNTLGGLILIGVDENEQSKPVLPLVGIDNDRGLAERVTHTIMTNLTPPVFPEIKVCENADSSKAILVIRIPQSNQAPHAINQNTRVYIRTNNISTPEDLASVDKIFWLQDKRSKSVLLRNKLIEEANERFYRIISNRSEEITNIEENCWLTILMLPLFPENFYLNPPELNRNTYRLSVKDVFMTRSYFPASNRDVGGTLFQNGIVLNDFFNERAYYCELNCFGLLYYKQNLYPRLNSYQANSSPTIRFNEVVARLHNFFEYAKNFYELISYKGYLYFQYEIMNIDKYPLLYNSESKQSIDKIVNVTKEYKIQDIESPGKDLYVDALKKLSWAYNFNIEETEVDQILNSFSS